MRVVIDQTRAQHDAKIVCLQSALFDYTGHVREELSKAQARRLVTQINHLRKANGWKPLKMRGRRRKRVMPAAEPT